MNRVPRRRPDIVWRDEPEEFIYDGKESKSIGTLYIAPPANTPYTLEQP